MNFKFNKGVYYVGDPGFVLPNDDLRMLFSWVMDGVLKSGPKRIETSTQSFLDDEGNLITKGDFYWSAAIPFRRGTIYAEDNTGKGVDWGCFGVVPWKWVESQGCHLDEKVEFLEPFECSSDDRGITIGHLRFNYEQQ